MQDAVKKYTTSPQGQEAYLCGLIPMVEAVRLTLQELGFPKEKIHFEKYV